jgi:DNA-binding NtrC family response regulator
MNGQGCPLYFSKHISQCNNRKLINMKGWLRRMPDNHRMLIYLVNNDSILIETLSDFLSNLGYGVRTIKSTELLDNLDKEPQPVDVIIGDFCMPSDRIVALISEVHKRYPTTTTILITDYNYVLSNQDAISYGVHAYLRKPIRLYELELMLFRLSEYRAHI